jgi:two-component system osmolarity sensor histidine kinase EnvZ
VSNGLLASGTLYALPSTETVPPALGEVRRQSGLPDISEAIGRYTTQPSEVRFTSEPGPRYWVSQQIDGETWWIVVLVGDPPPAPGGVPWSAVVAVLLALLGVAALYAATITRPLRELAAATHRVGEAWPGPVSVDGPAELRELADGFNAMLVRLRQIENERRVLLGGLPHDLRAPLTRLRLRLAALIEEGQHPGIDNDIASIDRVVRQFTEYLRGMQSDEPRTPLDEIAHAAVDAYRSLGRDVRLDASTHIQVAVPQFSVRRLLDNLIDNAVQHGQEPVRVQLSMPRPDLIELAVIDHGTGIPRETAELALEPFTKLDPARGRGGCGLGLAIVRQLARQLGGGVRFERQPNSFSVVASIGVE